LLFDVFFPDAFPLDFLLPFDSLFASPSASVDCLFAGAAYFAALIDMCMCTSCACIVAQKRIKHFFRVQRRRAEIGKIHKTVEFSCLSDD
jgi:hypothetical protein